MKKILVGAGTVVLILGCLYHVRTTGIVRAEAEKSCLQGKCPTSCCKEGGMDCCCLDFNTHECKCKDMPPPGAVEDWDG